MNPNRHLINPDYCDSLLDHPEYSSLNIKLGLPPQSVVLQEAVDEFGMDIVRDRIDHIETEAPFILFDNFFLANLPFFIRNWDRTMSLSNKIVGLARTLFTDAGLDEAIGAITENISHSFCHNRGLLAEIDLFTAAEAYLESFPPHMQITKEEFDKMTRPVVLCKPSEFWRMIVALRSGAMRCASQTYKMSGIDVSKKLKLGVVALKITDGCTRRCSFCFENATPDLEKAKKLTIEDLETMKPVLMDAGGVNLNGGECTEHPDFLKMCQWLSDNKILFNVTTTGGDIELLQELIKFYKNGSAISLTLSMHNFYGEDVRKLGSRTAAFFIRHNIPFTINFPVRNITDSSEVQPLCEDLFELLNCSKVQQGSSQGRAVNMFYTTGKFNRGPSVFLRVVPAYPTGRHVNDLQANMNAKFVAAQLMHRQGSTRLICDFGQLAVLPDKTVAPCCSALSGAHSGVPRVMDYLPTDTDELLQLTENYRIKMQNIYARADRAGVLPCFIHRKKQ